MSGEKNRIASAQKRGITGAVKRKSVPIDSICFGIRYTEHGQVMTAVELTLKLCFDRFSLQCMKFDDHFLALPIPIAYNVVSGDDVDLVVFGANDNPCSIAHPVRKLFLDSHDQAVNVLPQRIPRLRISNRTRGEQKQKTSND